MTQVNEVKQQVLDLINLFDSKKHDLQAEPAVGKQNLVFADVVLLNKTEKNPHEDSWFERRIVRTDMPQVFIWLFRRFAKILYPLPDYGMHKEELFGRLGNTLSMVEEQYPDASPDEKVAIVIQDFWEMCMDLLEGRVTSFAVALGASIVDDYVTRSISTGYVDQETFEAQLFGGMK
jgi:hypothetical protein